jgi:hypothetical protein
MLRHLLIAATVASTLSPPSRAAAPKPVEDDTHLRTRTFVLVLPGIWKQAPSGEAIALTREADTVFISPLESRTRLDSKSLQPVVARVVELRRKALSDISGGTAKFTPTLRTVKDERSVLYFSGEDPRNRKRFHVTVVGLPNVVVTITVYRPLTVSNSGFEDLANRIRWSVREPKPAA